MIHNDHIYIAGSENKDIDIYNPETNSYEVISSVIPSDADDTILMTVSGQHYIFRGTVFLKLDCEKRMCYQLADLPNHYW